MKLFEPIHFLNTLVSRTHLKSEIALKVYTMSEVN